MIPKKAIFIFQIISFFQSEIVIFFFFPFSFSFASVCSFWRVASERTARESASKQWLTQIDYFIFIQTLNMAPQALTLRKFFCLDIKCYARLLKVCISLVNVFPFNRPPLICVFFCISVSPRFRSGQNRKRGPDCRKRCQWSEGKWSETGLFYHFCPRPQFWITFLLKRDSLNWQIGKNGSVQKERK
jgi:hypothetical protein